jgi:hypothetical protein
MNRRFAAVVATCAAAVALVRCSTTTLDLGSDAPPSVTLPDAAIYVPQQGTATFQITGRAPAGETLSLGCNGSNGVDCTLDCGAGPPANPQTCTVSLLASGDPAPQLYPDGGTIFVYGGPANPLPRSSTPIAFRVVQHVVVSTNTQLDAGIDGTLQEEMATALQPADWQDGLFTAMPNAPATLQQLGAKHVLVQLMDFGAVPLKSYNSDKSQRSPSDWDFEYLDPIIDGIVAAGAQPLLQIAAIPYSAVDGGTLTQDQVTTLMTDYSVALVQYYNAGAMSWGPDGGVPRPGGAQPILWWTLVSDFNTMNPPWQPAAYTKFYSAVAPAMVSASPTPIRLVAFEYSDLNETSALSIALPAFLGGVAPSAPFDAVGLHFFGAYGNTAIDLPDQSVFANTAKFAKGDFALARQMVDGGAALWVTETNVQSEAPTSNGTYEHEPTVNFLNDPRGTSSFFAAWRPYEFSLLGKLGNQGLFHWEFTAGLCRPPNQSHCSFDDAGMQDDLDTQNAEADFTTGVPYLSYWVDYHLGHLFAGTPRILSLDRWTDKGNIEALATQNADGSVVVMVVNRESQDGGPLGTGVTNTVAVDIPQPFASLPHAEQVILDDATDPASPPATSVAPIASYVPSTTSWVRIVVTINRYGVAFIHLTP